MYQHCINAANNKSGKPMPWHRIGLTRSHFPVLQPHFLATDGYSNRTLDIFRKD